MTRQGPNVMEVLSRLDPRHRQVLVELYYRGHSVTETAARLGVPSETVKSRTYYALRRLKLLLEEAGAADHAANEVESVREDLAVPGGGEA